MSRLPSAVAHTCARNASEGQPARSHDYKRPAVYAGCIRGQRGGVQNVERRRRHARRRAPPACRAPRQEAPAARAADAGRRGRAHRAAGGGRCAAWHELSAWFKNDLVRYSVCNADLIAALERGCFERGWADGSQVQPRSVAIRLCYRPWRRGAGTVLASRKLCRTVCAHWRRGI